MTRLMRALVLSFIIVLSQPMALAQPKDAATLENIQGVVADEFKQFGIAVRNNDLTTIRRWMGKDFTKEVEILEKSNASTYRKYLAWQKIDIEIKSSNPPGVVKIIKDGVNLTTTSLTMHGVTTILVIERAAKALQTFLSKTGNIFLVAGYIVAVDNFLEVWNKDGDVALATYKLIVTTVTTAIAAVGVYFPAVAPETTFIASVITVFLDWIPTAGYNYYKRVWNETFLDVMNEFRKTADKKDWVAEFKNGSIEGLQQSITEEWESPTWRSKLDQTMRDWLVENKKYVEKKGPERYFRDDAAPVLKGWINSEVRYATELTAEKIHEYIVDLMSQVVRIHIRPIYVDFKGNPIQIRPMVTVHDQPIPFQYDGISLMKREDSTDPHIDLVIKAGHKELDITKTTITQAGTDIQIVVPMKHFLRMMSHSNNHLDVDATLVRPDFPMPEMDLPVWPFPLRLDDLKEWYKHGLQISREDKQTHIGVVGGTRIIIPTVPVKVKLKNSQGGVPGGSVKVSSSSVKIDAQGHAIVQVPSVGKTWIGYSSQGRTTGDGVIVNGGRLKPVNPSTNTVTLTVATGGSSGRPNLPKLPPLPKVDVNSPIQDANTAITMLESRSMVYDEAWRIYSEASSLVKTEIESAKNQWNSYKVALERRLHASNVPAKEIQKTIDSRRTDFFADVTDAEQTLDAVVERMQKAIDNIRKENQRRLEGLQLAADRGQKPYAALRKMEEETRAALAIANRLRPPRQFEKLADVETDRRQLAKHIGIVDNMRGNFNHQLVDLRAQNNHLSVELEQYGEFLLTPGSLFRFEYDYDKFQSYVSTHVSFEARIATIEAILDASECDNTLNALRKSDGNLSWLQLKSTQQLALAEELLQLRKNAPGFLKTDPPELAQCKDLMDGVNDIHHTMVVTSNRGKAKRPKGKPHNGFGMDAYETYQPMPDTWALMKGRMTSMVNSSQAWEEAYLNKLEEVRQELKTLNPNRWYVYEVANALKNAASSCPELGRREALERALEQGTVAMDGLAQAQASSWLAGKDFDALLATNLTAFDLLQTALSHAKAGDLGPAEKARKQAMDGFPTSIKRGMPEELWMLLRVERLLMDVDRLIGELKSKEFDANLAELIVELRGTNLDKVYVGLVDKNGVTQAIGRNATGTRYTGRVPAGTYTVTAMAAGLRITPDTVTFDLPKRGSKTIVMQVESAVDGGDGNTQSILTSLTKFHPSSRILVEDYNVPEERPSFSMDNRYVVATLSPGMVRCQISNSAIEKLITEHGDTPYKLDKSIGLGGTHPIVVGDTVVSASFSLYVPGHLPDPSIDIYMAVPLDGGKSTFLFDLPDTTHLVDARFTQEPEYLVVGEFSQKKGWFILRGTSPDLATAEFVVHHPEGYAQAANVSRDWNVFAMTSYENYGQWTIFDKDGRVLAKTPKGDRWQTVTLGPKGKFFVAQHPDPDDMSAELVIAEVSRPDVYLPIHTGAVNMGSMGWSPDGRLLAGRVFHEGQQVQLRLFDLFGGTGPKPKAYKFDPNKKGKKQDKPPRDENNEVARDDQDAYNKYIEAYNALTSLMAEGKGDTPEAQEAYQKYKEAKDAYEAALENNPTELISN